MKFNHQYLALLLQSLVFLLASNSLYAAESSLSTSNSLFKMLIGLAIVLLVLAVISWLMKKYMGGNIGQKSVIKVVGGASVGTRERVMVLEVSGRWLVVGVAPGQVNAIANLEAGDMQSSYAVDAGSDASDNQQPPHRFAKWLSASTAKMTEK